MRGRRAAAVALLTAARLAPVLLAPVLLAPVLLAPVLLGMAVPAQASTRHHPLRYHLVHHHARHARHPVHHVHRPRSPRRHASAPWVLTIPAIHVAAAIIPTGVNWDGSVAAPSLANAQKVGWYRYGAAPGAPGRAVLLGHVDTYTGPGAFYRLYLVRRGDHVNVRADGRSMTFSVTSIQQVSKQDFPASVYAPGRAPVLYLVTCAGTFDYVTRHYSDNIIVTARLRQTGPHRLRAAVPPRL